MSEKNTKTLISYFNKALLKDNTTLKVKGNLKIKYIPKKWKFKSKRPEVKGKWKKCSVYIVPSYNIVKVMEKENNNIELSVERLVKW